MPQHNAAFRVEQGYGTRVASVNGWSASPTGEIGRLGRPVGLSKQGGLVDVDHLGYRQ